MSRYERALKEWIVLLYSEGNGYQLITMARGTERI
jgi:hypothetical protein